MPRAVGQGIAATCTECGQEFPARRRDARYCSPTCRARVSRRGHRARRCAACRQSLPAGMRSHARYCSTACRKRAHQRRAAEHGAEGGGAS